MPKPQMGNDYKLLGKSYTPPDLYAKITGRAKYAEDFRVEGMAFAKLLLSPMPHARVRSIDAKEALAMPGVLGMITAEDLPKIPDPPGEAPLTNEPLYAGEPILAIAAVDEETAANAVAAVKVDLEPLPFVIDPLQSLRPDGPNARSEGNTFKGRDIATVKWDQSAFDNADKTGGFPIGEAPDSWNYGDLDAAFAKADLVLEKALYHQTVTHHPMEPRSAMAYWRNGKCYIFAGTQSEARTRAAMANELDMDMDDLVFVSDFCGGGFGSKISGAYVFQIPAVLSKKINRPVMMRVTRAEETFFGRARPGFQGWVKMGFRKDGKVTAIDLFVIQENGPYSRQGDYFQSGNVASLLYQPEAMRWRGAAILTNTPPKSAQRGPGGAQTVAVLDPLMDQAAEKLGIDRLAIRRLNVPDGNSTYGPSKSKLTSAYVREAIDKGAALFNWDEKKKLSRQKNGSKVTGIGMAVSPFVGGSTGYDSLMVLKPDGKLYIHQGIGNLGTHSVIDTARVAAEILQFPWEKVEVVWGDSRNNLPWSSSQSGSQTTHAHTRANHAGGMDLKRKLQEIAAHDLGGRPDDYEMSGGRIYRKGNRSKSMTFAHAAERAIALGGKYDGHEVPKEINSMTKTSAAALAGQGAMGVAKDTYPHDGGTWSFTVGFARVELDTETGQVEVKEYCAAEDCGTVVNPRGLAAQVHGAGVQGLGMALMQNWYYDHQWGENLSTRFYQARPPTILDVPREMQFVAVDKPDPQTPVGAKGTGEPPVGAGEAAVISAVADAMGGVFLARTPLRPDVILASLEGIELPYTLETHV